MKRSSHLHMLYGTFFLIFLLINPTVQEEHKTVFGIGKRYVGDQLLMKDTLQTPAVASLTEEPKIIFNYAIDEPITYIELISDKNVQAVLDFSYENDIIKGSITAENGVPSDALTVQIQVFGYKSNIANIRPEVILNKNQQFSGYLRAIPNGLKYESLNLMNHETTDATADDKLDYDDHDGFYDDDGADDEGEDYENIYDDDEEDFFESEDKIIVLGSRQKNDYLIYETEKTTDRTEKPANHSVTFYYIDSNYITYIQFIIYNDFASNQTASDYMPPLAEYSHYSPTSLKAVITDYNKTNTFVAMKMYGYEPKDVPVDYKFFLPNHSSGVTEAPMSSLRRLKIFMNAEQQQQQRQQQYASDKFNKMQNPNDFLEVEQEEEYQWKTTTACPDCWAEETTMAIGKNAGNMIPTGHLTIYNLIFLVIAAIISI